MNHKVYQNYSVSSAPPFPFPETTFGAQFRKLVIIFKSICLHYSVIPFNIKTSCVSSLHVGERLVQIEEKTHSIIHCLSLGLDCTEFLVLVRLWRGTRAL